MNAEITVKEYVKEEYGIAMEQGKVTPWYSAKDIQPCSKRSWGSEVVKYGHGNVAHLSFCSCQWEYWWM